MSWVQSMRAPPAYLTESWIMIGHKDLNSAIHCHRANFDQSVNLRVALSLPVLSFAAAMVMIRRAPALLFRGGYQPQIFC